MITFDEFKTFSVREQFDYLYENDFLDTIEFDYCIEDSDSDYLHDMIDENFRRDDGSWLEVLDALIYMQGVVCSNDWVYKEKDEFWDEWKELTPEIFADIVSYYSYAEGYPFIHSIGEINTDGLKNLL